MPKIIPFTSEPNQTLVVNVPINDENKLLELNVRYNTEDDFWWLRISDAKSNTILLDNIPLVLGTYPSANLLKQYAYMNLGSIVIVPAGYNVLTRPTDENLGTEFYVMWGDNIE